MKTSNSLVGRTVDTLAAMSLAATAGDHLGAEDDLLGRLGVSRPTLRQAAKIVESDRLIAVRRGTRGGFFAARPDAADAIRAPARYLRLNGATIADVHAVTRLIGEEAAVAAARCSDAALRAQLTEFRDRTDGIDTALAMVRAETALARLIAAMSGNPAAQLFIEIGYTFGHDEHGVQFYRSETDRAAARTLQRAVCDAVLAGDAEIARLMMQRRAAMITAWLAAGT